MDIKVNSFIEREVKLLQYVKNRNLIDLSKLPDDNYIYNLYKLDIPERHVRIKPMIKAFHTKVRYLRSFQEGNDIWKRNY